MTDPPGEGPDVVLEDDDVPTPDPAEPLRLNQIFVGYDEPEDSRGVPVKPQPGQDEPARDD